MASASQQINQDAQLMANPFRSGDFGVSAIQNRLGQESKTLDPNYQWANDPGAEAFRSDLGREQNALRSKMRDTLQGGASPMAVARETAKWDAQTRRDVLGYIADRKKQAQSSVDSLLGQLSAAESRKADYDMKQAALAEEKRRYEQQQALAEQARRKEENKGFFDAFNPFSIGKAVVGGLTGGIGGLISSVIGDAFGDDNDDVGRLHADYTSKIRGGG